MAPLKTNTVDSRYKADPARAGAYIMEPAARESLIVEYAPLVKRIAGRMAMRLPSSVVFDELISAGCLGLIDAVDRYDPSKNVTLRTYAEYRIKGAILDELRSMDWYSRSMRKKIQDIEKALQKIETMKGSPAEDTEVANELGLTLPEYQKRLSDIHGAALLSLDEFIKNEDNDSSSMNSFQERLKSTDDPEKNIGKEELKKVAANAIRRLSEKEQVVISLYYYEELTLKEIGSVLNLTESRICQIHTAALLKLQARLKEYNED